MKHQSLFIPTLPLLPVGLLCNKWRSTRHSCYGLQMLTAWASSCARNKAETVQKRSPKNQLYVVQGYLFWGSLYRSWEKPKTSDAKSPRTHLQMRELSILLKCWINVFALTCQNAAKFVKQENKTLFGASNLGKSSKSGFSSFKHPTALWPWPHKFETLPHLLIEKQHAPTCWPSKGWKIGILQHVCASKRLKKKDLTA